MTRIHPAWLAREERYWLRHDAHRWRRPDHARFDKPQRVERKYSPDQPRVPAGHPDGGQWTREGGSSALLAPLNIPSDALSLFEGDGEAAGPSVQLAYLAPLLQGAAQAGRGAVLGLEAALAAFAGLSAINGPNGTAAVTFRASEFAAPEADPKSALVEVARLTPDEVDQFCPAHGFVQNLTDKVAAPLNREDYSPQQYGTAVHTGLRREVDNLNDPNLQSEVSLLKTLQETGSRPPGESQIARYGQRGSIRIDVLERAGSYTACVYDIKTGIAVLDRWRMREIARTVLYRYPGTLRIIVVEVRPGR